MGSMCLILISQFQLKGSYHVVFSKLQKITTAVKCMGEGSFLSWKFLKEQAYYRLGFIDKNDLKS